MITNLPCKIVKNGIVAWVCVAIAAMFATLKQRRDVECKCWRPHLPSSIYSDSSANIACFPNFYSPPCQWRPRCPPPQILLTILDSCSGKEFLPKSMVTLNSHPTQKISSNFNSKIQVEKHSTPPQPWRVVHQGTACSSISTKFRYSQEQHYHVNVLPNKNSLLKL